MQFGGNAVSTYEAANNFGVEALGTTLVVATNGPFVALMALDGRAGQNLWNPLVRRFSPCTEPKGPALSNKEVNNPDFAELDLDNDGRISGGKCVPPSACGWHRSAGRPCRLRLSQALPVLQSLWQIVKLQQFARQLS